MFLPRNGGKPLQISRIIRCRYINRCMGFFWPVGASSLNRTRRSKNYQCKEQLIKSKPWQEKAIVLPQLTATYRGGFSVSGRLFRSAIFNKEQDILPGACTWNLWCLYILNKIQNYIHMANAIRWVFHMLPIFWHLLFGRPISQRLFFSLDFVQYIASWKWWMAASEALHQRMIENTIFKLPLYRCRRLHQNRNSNTTTSATFSPLMDDLRC